MHPFRMALAVLTCTAVALTSAVAPASADVVGAVRGTLTRADRTPLGAVPVTLAGDRTSQTAVTGSDGKFAFARVPFGHYTLRASTPDGLAVAELDVGTDAIVDVRLIAAAVIGRTGATTTSVRGTPVSENAYGARRLAALPRNDRLDAIVEQVPGVVRFSYDEPVAHGFHGLSYELDGAPLPQSTSSNFAQLIDPRNAQAVEIFTGAFPAEFGGSRQGAIVNVLSGGTEAGAGLRPAAEHVDDRALARAPELGRERAGEDLDRLRVARIDQLREVRAGRLRQRRVPGRVRGLAPRRDR